MNYQEWIEKQSRMAHALESGAIEGSYAEGAIILCAALGTMSSLLWQPAPKTDGKRFIEIVVRCSAGGPDTTRVSAALFAETHPELAPALGISNKSLCLTGRDDRTESEVITAATAGVVNVKKTVRSYAYATLLYKQVRCGFIHTYQPGEKATEFDQLRGFGHVAKDEISYVNNLVHEKGCLVTRRLIYFPLQWISAVALAVARVMDDECSRHDKYPLQNIGLPLPLSWWSAGG